MSTLHSVAPTGHDVTTPAPPGRGAPRADGPVRYAPGPVDESATAYARRRTLRVLLVGVVALSDVILIKSTWDVALQQPSWVSWTTAVMAALAGAALMWAAGHQVAWRRVYGGRGVAITALVLAWLALGAGLTYLRWTSGDLTTVVLDVEGAGVPTSGASDQHQVLALALLALFVAPGLLAFRDSADLHHPIAAEQRRSHEHLRRLRSQLEILEGEAVESDRLLTQAVVEAKNVLQRAEHSKRAQRALAEELKAHARAEILRQIGDPAAGGLTDPAARPSVPDPSSDTSCVD